MDREYKDEKGNIVVILKTEKLPKKVSWMYAKFKSENMYKQARVCIQGNNAFILLSQTGKTVGKYRHLFFEILDFRNQSVFQIENILYKGLQGTYPLGRNFHEALIFLCKFGMRLNAYTMLKPLKMPL